jgi:hypothetical protein
MRLIAKLFGKDSPENGTVPFTMPRRRNFYSDHVPEDNDADAMYDALKGDTFAPEQSYFSVRLVEMRLASAGSYVAKYLPMCTCFLRYTYGDTQREVPFVIGYDMIRAQLGKDAPEAGAGNVEFRNIYIVRNAPVKATKLQLYAALCRVTDTTFARGMLDLLSDAAGAIGGPAAGAIVRGGVDMTKRLSALLSADGVSTRFGLYDGQALRKSGYRVFAGAGSEALDASALTMKGGQLVQEGAGAGRTVDDVDYLVVAFEHRKTIVDEGLGEVSELPFHAFWTPVREKLLGNDVTGADEAFRTLALAVVRSNDMTESDRLAMITAYRVEMERWKKATADLPSRRGSEDSSLQTRLATAADVTQRRDRTLGSVLKSVKEIVDDRVNQQPAGAQTLEPRGLAQTAALIRARTDKSRAKGKTLSEASAEFLSAALASPL